MRSAGGTGSGSSARLLRGRGVGDGPRLEVLDEHRLLAAAAQVVELHGVGDLLHEEAAEAAPGLGVQVAPGSYSGMSDGSNGMPSSCTVICTPIGTRSQWMSKLVRSSSAKAPWMTLVAASSMRRSKRPISRAGNPASAAKARRTPGSWAGRRGRWARSACSAGGRRRSLWAHAHLRDQEVRLATGGRAGGHNLSSAQGFRL